MTTKKVEVTLMIFSGRPNPKWSLSDAQAETLRAKLAQLREAKPAAPPGLGYQGLLATNPERAPGIPDQIIVFRGVISATREGKTSHFEDSNKVEDWLLAQARELGYGRIIDVARSYLKP